MGPDERLSAADEARLRSLLARGGQSDLLELVDALGTRLLRDDEIERLESALLSSFLGSLGADDEPTREGAEIDELIGKLQPYGEAWHRTEP